MKGILCLAVGIGGMAKRVVSGSKFGTKHSSMYDSSRRSGSIRTDPRPDPVGSSGPILRDPPRSSGPIFRPDGMLSREDGSTELGKHRPACQLRVVCVADLRTWREVARRLPRFHRRRVVRTSDLLAGVEKVPARKSSSSGNHSSGFRCAHTAVCKEGRGARGGRGGGKLGGSNGRRGGRGCLLRCLPPGPLSR